MSDAVRLVRVERPELSMAEEVCHALSSAPRSIPSKYFYDDRGSRLFDEITRLEEYYQTRTEEAILDAVADAVVERYRPEELVELGSGVGRKTRRLLKAMFDRGLLKSCTLFDVNETFLRDSLEGIGRLYPTVDRCGVVGDFCRDLDKLGSTRRKLIVFFAGTIGNLHPRDEAPDFLRRVAREMRPEDGLLIGVDLVKDPARLELAYNDPRGVTAAFNLNILNVLNSRLGSDFDPRAYEHRAFYDRQEDWIEMRLRSLADQRVHICGLELQIARGEEIRTEISCKYTRDSFARLLATAGLRLKEWHTDPENLFALSLSVGA